LFWAFYKPRKVLSDIKKNDDRKIISDFLPTGIYFFIVGRLDYDSEGLILLTNNGEVANKLTHPRYEHEKEYQVLVSRSPDEKQLKAWRSGVVLPSGEKTHSAIVEILPIEKSGVWLKIVLKEGKKRQIRETGLAIGLPVKRIIRKRIGPIELGRLKSGQWRELSTLEVKKLIDLL
jgi:23S rRNA pseudouridine2605 synthase